jgi:thiol-disulfide isomerase/thioredoxin
MKALLTSLVLASAAAVAQQEAPEPTLKAGSSVEIEAVTAAKWVQGEPLTAFEPGKVYMFECWATWCGPCIAAIPHVNELHKKYYDKGLRVYGMNVWEDGLDKVEKFVKAKGDGMSYPIAYTGKGSAFETAWLKAAGVRGIPHAFIVKDGKLVLTSHPSQLTDSVIEALLSGDEGAQKAAAQINAAVEARGKTTKVMQEFRKAAGANDTATMSAKIEELEKIDAASPYLGPMKFEILIAKKDWPAATKNLDEMPEGPGKQMAVTMTASKIGTVPDGEFPVDFIKAVTRAFTAMANDANEPKNPYTLIILTGLQWKSGDKDAATASAENALKLASNQPEGRKLPAAPFEKFAKSVKDGTLPTMQEFSGWLREASGNQ